jgi:glutamate dehydrogenase
VHEFIGRAAQTPVAMFDHIKAAFEETFVKVCRGEMEDGNLNSLSLCAALSWDAIVVLRCFARYLRQLRVPYSNELLSTTFLSHPRIARHIYTLFVTKHDPDFRGNRTERMREIEKQLDLAMKDVTVLEEDQIIRRFANLVHASLRTNYFQRTENGAPKSYLSIKFDSQAVDFMPLPKPLYEIYVYSTRTEAVHLRGGKVARGGIRWSDRRDDFRFEILGLMKAQMVKNSVIVPVGSKGGFIVKRPPADAEKFQAEGIACYRIMMQGLLDITDNRIGGKTVPPARVVRHDGDDPYLVVAADKGTAKFSDIANGIAQDYGFWLDDAFASGGSAGYDHKEMGITARGAWEAIKRHFREMGKDIQKTDFTCVGVGDMSGDVFGNGMLLSKHIRLIAAFDHRHIFCDPNPDAAESYAERKRMFDLPRSSWMDYDRSKISKGGGVFSRNEKLIPISAEMKKVLGVTADQMTPADLMQTILKADVEMLYFGGIGTYVKSHDESNDDVRDRATDALRIDGQDIRAKVIGEGANLALTQRGRVEYAAKGGRINTDAIDNSAGVDTSDHEVNIKILLRQAVDKGDLTIPARNKLLAKMTDDVAALVLRDNYLQTQALSIAETMAYETLSSYARTIHILERGGLLNRAIEYLPDDAEIAERQRLGKGLTRPELSVLLAYAKIRLYADILESKLPDDPALQDNLHRYFPETLRKSYAKEIDRHQLRREIVATSVTNSLINRTSTNYVLTAMDRTGRTAAEVAYAFVLARDAFDMHALWTEIEALDNKVPAAVQINMLLIVNRTLMRAMTWFLTNGTDAPSRAAARLQTYRKDIGTLAAWLDRHPSAVNGTWQRTEGDLKTKGVPAPLAHRIALMPVLALALDFSHLAEQIHCGIDSVASVSFALERRLGLDWLLEDAKTIPTRTPWKREAIASLTEEVNLSQLRLVGQIIGKGGKNKAGRDDRHPDIEEWLNKRAARLERFDAMMAEWKATGNADTAMLMLASRAVGRLLN